MHLTFVFYLWRIQMMVLFRLKTKMYHIIIQFAMPFSKHRMVLFRTFFLNQTKKITLILNNLGILTISHKPFVANIGWLSQTFSLFFLESNKQPQLYTVHFGPLSYSSFSQLLRQSNWLTFPKSKADRFFCTMWPATEKSLFAP